MTVKTITLKGNAHVIRKESIALGAITPGHLIERAAGGVQVHGSVGENAARSFAVENEVVGKEIGDAYATDDTVLYGVFPPGSEVFAIAGTAGVTIFDFLESGGDGRLVTLPTEAATPETARHSVVAQALETSAVGVRVKVEVL